MAEIPDMTQGVRGQVQDQERELADRHFVARRDALVGGHPRVLRADHADPRKALAQARHTADMVGVVVRQDDRGGLYIRAVIG